MLRVGWVGFSRFSASLAQSLSQNISWTLHTQTMKHAHPCLPNTKHVIRTIESVSNQQVATIPRAAQHSFSFHLQFWCNLPPYGRMMLWLTLSPGHAGTTFRPDRFPSDLAPVFSQCILIPKALIRTPLS